MVDTVAAARAGRPLRVHALAATIAPDMLLEGQQVRPVDRSNRVVNLADKE